MAANKKSLRIDAFGCINWGFKYYVVALHVCVGLQSVPSRYICFPNPVNPRFKGFDRKHISNWPFKGFLIEKSKSHKKIALKIKYVTV
jgi:hypothetical protein